MIVILTPQQTFITQLQQKIGFFRNEVLLLLSQQQISSDVWQAFEIWLLGHHNQLVMVFNQPPIYQQTHLNNWLIANTNWISGQSFVPMALQVHSATLISANSSYYNNAQSSTLNNSRETANSQYQLLVDLLQELLNNQKRLLEGQANILSKIDLLKQDILFYIDRSHQQTIKVVLEKLYERDLQLIKAVLRAVDESKIELSEQFQIVQDVRYSLINLEYDFQTQSQQERSRWAELHDILKKDDISWQDKVKLAVPIIPGVLAVESSISDLSKLWNKYKKKFLG